MGSNPTIHVNHTLRHQVLQGQALADGFRRHGLKPVVTNVADEPGDWHVVLGPWFAASHWPDCLYLDRAYWGDPDCVSLHWMKDGEKIRPDWDMPREHPELEPIKDGDRTVFLCDFKGQPFGKYNTVRYHPSEKPSRYTLDECLDMHDVARGRRTTALVAAHIRGLRVETDDPNSPVWGITDRQRWVNSLAWHNWTYSEIAAGEMWHHFK